MKFDLSTIPAGAVVVDAYLSISVTALNTAGLVGVTATALTTNWTENSLCGAAGDVSWSNASTGVAWSVPGGGGDFNAASLMFSSVALPTTGGYRIQITNLSEIQAWVNNPASNYGFVLMGPESASISDYADVASKENTTIASRPFLEVHYR